MYGENAFKISLLGIIMNGEGRWGIAPLDP
jgi:hypothetical protein